MQSFGSAQYVVMFFQDSGQVRQQKVIGSHKRGTLDSVLARTGSTGNLPVGAARCRLKVG